MITLEWHVGTLRQRGLPIEEMTHEDQLAVLTHAFRRRLARPVDALTQEPATVWDLLALLHAVRGGRRGSASDGEPNTSLHARLLQMRAARGGQRGGGGDRGD